MFNTSWVYSKVTTDEEKVASYHDSPTSSQECLHCKQHAIQETPQASLVSYLGWFLLLALSAFVVLTRSITGPLTSHELIKKTSSYCE